jgi:hypothetical protein
MYKLHQITLQMMHCQQEMLCVLVLGSVHGICLLKILPNFHVNTGDAPKKPLNHLTFVFLLALLICHLLNPTRFSPIFIISFGVRIDVTLWLSLLIAWSTMMRMLARVVALLIVEG